MELILKTDNEEQIAMIIAFAKKLNVFVEAKKPTVMDPEAREALKQRIISFKPNETNKGKLSSLLAGSIDKEKAAELHKELGNLRNEWD